jgi:ABC-2 type transport system permease protein
MLRRHAQSKIVGLIEHVLSILWCIAAVMMVMGHWAIAILPTALACLTLWLSRARAPSRQPSSKLLTNSSTPTATRGSRKRSATMIETT